MYSDFHCTVTVCQAMIFVITFSQLCYTLCPVVQTQPRKEPTYWRKFMTYMYSSDAILLPLEDTETSCTSIYISIISSLIIFWFADYGVRERVPLPAGLYKILWADPWGTIFLMWRFIWSMLESIIIVSYSAGHVVRNLKN